MRRLLLSLALLFSIPLFGQHVYVEIDLGAIRRQLDLRSITKYDPTYPPVTCGITTVGYRFVGEPGQSFTFAGQQWQIEPDGDTELIRYPRDRATYHANGRRLPLDVWPHNQFGFREVPVPRKR